ncbi:Hypothetical protein PHPALM_19293 [Phytophthora palmivora]|uniref:ZSWIM1/3 RNaseH-like domain-containing protein n=1 Tax=Phytophthora palmivora TaxID=4796 RepID=A0A2P4XHP9_9STRA|nr:Hypothetical protein PHPALM_19293 [Phytophthora palmivora]
MYSQNRAAVIEHPYLTHEADLMRRIGSNKRAAREHIETLTGKVCTMKDMHNLYARLKKREKSSHVTAPPSQPQQDATGNSLHVDIGDSQSAVHMTNSDPNTTRVESILQHFVDIDLDNHVSILSGVDGSNEAICLASRAMKEHFQVFSELVILDISMTSQPDAEVGQQLHGFLSMDNLGNAKPVFLVCQDFKRTHPKWRQIKVLAMNKLLPDALSVLTSEFPEARPLLCQFHRIHGGTKQETIELD